MTVTREILNDLSRTIQVVVSESAASRNQALLTFNGSLSPTTLHVTDAITGALDVVWIAKDVVFKDSSLEPSLDATALTSDGGGAANPAHRIARGLPIPDVTQALTGAISGSLTGTSMGALTGTVTGTLTGATTLTGPVAGNVSGPISGVLNGTVSSQGGGVIGTMANAPGLLGQLRGNVPLAIGEIPVALSVTWSVLDADMTPLATVAEGTGFVAPGGLNLPTVSIIFMPAIVRLTHTPPPLSHRIVRATVVLSVALVMSDPINIDSRVEVPALPIPTILALFRHPNFAASSRAGADPGVVMLVVPAASPLASFGDFTRVLGLLNDTVSALTSIPAAPGLDLAAFLLGLSTLRGALAAPQPIVIVDGENSIPFLNAFRVDRGVFTIPIIDVDLLPLDCEVRFDSLIFVGKSGDGASLFNNRSFDGTGGQLDVSTGGEMFVIIRDLRSATPAAEPMGTTPVVTVITAPDGRLSPRSRDPFDWGHRVTTFGHEFSSLRLNLP
jgi:hypothetical protein